MDVVKDTSFDPFPIYYVGPSLDVEGIPTFLYFSISGEESLTLPPYNQVAELLYQKGLRILSWTLPGHHEGQDKNTAMSYWAKNLDELAIFIANSHLVLDQLFERRVISTEQFAVGGLSRGGFIATHLLSHSQVQYALGIAPLVDLSCLSETHSFEKKEFKTLLLESLFEQLYSKNLFYLVGNRDERISTDYVFNWVRKLTDYAYDKRVRSPNLEMRIFPSTGYRGHGSLPFVFEEGALWIQKKIVR